MIEMNKTYKIKINQVEIKWGFIYIPSKIAKQLPTKIHVSYEDQHYHLIINKASRIVSKKLMNHLKLKENNSIILNGKDDQFSISVKQ